MKAARSASFLLIRSTAASTRDFASYVTMSTYKPLSGT